MPYLVGALLVLYAVGTTAFIGLLLYRLWEWVCCLWWDR